MSNEKTKKIQQVITEYAKKYARLYTELDELIAKGTSNRRFALYLDKNYQRCESLAVGAVHYCIEDIRELSKQLREDLTVRELADDALLPEDLQRKALRLDFTLTYYQLNCLSLDNWSDIDYFARTSKVEFLTEHKPSSLQKQHLREIETKIRELEL